MTWPQSIDRTDGLFVVFCDFGFRFFIFDLEVTGRSSCVLHDGRGTHGGIVLALV
jgi:hypothetical protein